MEADIPPPIEDIIAELAGSDQALAYTKLANLSNLNPEELRSFKQAWQNIAPERRRQILHRLAELAENNVELNFDDIFRFCLRDEDAEVRSKAIESLWEDEEPPLIDPLIKLLNEDTSDKVQATAAAALSKFALLAELGKLRSNHTARLASALLAALDDKNKTMEVRQRSLEAAAPLSLPQVKEAITEAYWSNDAKLKKSALYAMGKNCDPSWLPVLLNELESGDNEARYEAAGACGELGEEEAVPHLVKLTDDPDSEVQLAAIQALGKIGGSKAKACLVQRLDSPDDIINQAAEQALEQLEAEENPLNL